METLAWLDSEEQNLAYKRTRVDKIECSVWNNGGKGWGLKVLGGLDVRERHFRRTHSPILIDLDGTHFPFNIDKESFWTPPCGELIGVALRNWIAKNGLNSGNRVWLEIVTPYKIFKAVRARA
jgi:hypothetical protein